jgi:hypothetical protein
VSMSDKFHADPAGILAGQCAYCRHAARHPGGVYCPAFPGGVPPEVLRNDFDHRTAHPDEYQPVRLELRDDVPAEVAARLYHRLEAAGGRGS